MKFNKNSIVLVIAALIIAFVTTIKVNNTNYYLLPLLPFIYALMLALYLAKSAGELGTVQIIVILTGFVRMTVIPLFMCLSEFTIFFGYYNTVIDNAACEKSMPLVCILMCYEQIVVFLCLIFSRNNAIDLAEAEQRIHRRIRIKQGNFLFELVVLCLFAFIMVFGAKYTSLNNYYSFVFNMKDALDFGYNIQGNAPSVIYRLYIWFVDILQLIVPVILVSSLKKSRFQNGSKLFLFFVIDFLTLCFMTDDRALSIIYTILLIIWFFLDYNKIPKGVYLVFAIIGIFGVTALLQKSLVNKYYGSERMIILSGTLNAYFSGPYNIAASVVMSENLSLFSRVESFFGDLLNSIPFMPVFFKNMITTPKLFNEAVKGSGAVTTKILPMIGQGYYYFTAVLAPVLSGISINVALRFQKKISYAKNEIDRYIYLYVAFICAISPSIYNVNILIKNLFNLFIIYCILRLRNDE